MNSKDESGERPQRCEPEIKATPIECKNMIQTWLNRAHMAYSQNNIDLSKIALVRISVQARTRGPDSEPQGC